MVLYLFEAEREGLREIRMGRVDNDNDDTVCDVTAGGEKVQEDLGREGEETRGEGRGRGRR